MKLIQIVPKLPPEVDGIGDYAFFLAQQLLNNHQVKTDFIVCNPGFKPGPEATSSKVLVLHQRQAQSLIESVPNDADTILLHYSDYPYDPKFGSPFWLLSALEQLKKNRTFKIVVMFHEFPCFYLRKNLYLLPIQKYVAERLATFADVALTNNSATRSQLSKLPIQTVDTIGVFSNIGEPGDLPAVEHRQPWMVVFGTPGRRARIYQKAIPQLTHISQVLGIEKILDIGSPLSLELAEINGIPLEQWGRQPADKVSQLMMQSLAGIAYSSDNQKLSKSGVFAAYCAHGLVPVISNPKSSPMDGLFEGKNFLFA